MNLEGMSLKKKFWRFVWPSVVAQWIFALYTMVDGMFVARGVSEVALSAVNIASPFVNFLFSVSILFAVGTSTVVAIFLGQEMCIRDRDDSDMPPIWRRSAPNLCISWKTI